MCCSFELGWFSGNVHLLRATQREFQFWLSLFYSRGTALNWNRIASYRYNFLCESGSSFGSDEVFIFLFERKFPINLLRSSSAGKKDMGLCLKHSLSWIIYILRHQEVVCTWSKKHGYILNPFFSQFFCQFGAGDAAFLRVPFCTLFLL